MTDFLEFQKTIREDPEFFFTDVLGSNLWEKEREILQGVQNHRKVTVRSSNSAGKTYTIPRIALWFLVAYGPAVVINTAPTDRQVRNQYWREFRHAYKKAKLKLGGKLMKTQYEIDENWFALGFSTKEGEDGMEKWQGWHADNIMFIVDEASGVHPSVFQAIEGGLAGGGNIRLVLIGNPTRNTGDFAESFTDPSFHKIHISAFDVPNVKYGKVIIPGLATKEWVEDMKFKYGVDSDVYRVRVLGEFPRADSDTLIGVDLVSSAIGADRELYGEEEWLGLDPARFGTDRAGFIYRKGNFAKVLEVIKSSDTMLLAGKSKVYLKQFPKAKLKIDITGGLGAGTYDRLREQPDVASRVFGVNVAATPSDKETYVNIRMEGWAAVKEWLRDAVLEEHEGWYQLAKPRYKITSAGKLQLESKEDMKKRGIPSPDIGDALALTFQRPTEGGDEGFTWLE